MQDILLFKKIIIKPALLSDRIFKPLLHKKTRKFYYSSIRNQNRFRAEPPLDIRQPSIEQTFLCPIEALFRRFSKFPAYRERKILQIPTRNSSHYFFPFEYRMWRRIDSHPEASCKANICTELASRVIY